MSPGTIKRTWVFMYSVRHFFSILNKYGVCRQNFVKVPSINLTLWPWSWTFTVQHTIYVKCEYFMNQEG